MFMSSPSKTKGAALVPLEEESEGGLGCEEDECEPGEGQAS
jgi:hypothetical protein